MITYPIRRILARSCLFLLLAVSFSTGLLAQESYTDPALGTYFLDAVNGDDDNTGTSPETAWQTLDRLSSVRLKEGEVVLFKAGDVFVGRFYLWGSGTPENPIVFGAYGTGPKPLLQGGEVDREVIYITGDRGLEFRNLRISNSHPQGTIPDRYGIHLEASAGSGDMKHLHFHHLDFVNIEGADPENESRGIMATALDFGDEPDSLRSRFNVFIIEDCYFENIDGRAVQLRDFNQTLTDQRIRGTNYYPTIGFLFQNNTGFNINRNMLMIRGTKGAVIQHNYMSGTEEGSAFWPFDTEGTLVQFNDFRHLRNPNADSYVCHFDYNCIDSVMQYNFGYDVDGGLIEIIVLSDFAFFQEDAIARYNVGVDVGFRNTENSAGIFLTGRVTRSKVYNNTIITTDLHSSYKAMSVKSWGGEWPDNNEIYNNLFLATGSRASYNDIFRLSERNNVLSHNLYHGNISVPSAELAAVTGDPLLVNPGSLDPADMKLTEGSPAIGAGLIIQDNGCRDYFGNPVPQDLVPSIGFHEFQTEGFGKWAGYEIDDNGLVDTGSAFLGWLWIDEAGASGWTYSFSAGAWMYLPEDTVQSALGAWVFMNELSGLLPADGDGIWFPSSALGTWVAAPGGLPVSGAGWSYVLDLNSTL